MLRGEALSFHTRYLHGKAFSYQELVSALQEHFETEERQNLFLSRWLTLQFSAFEQSGSVIQQLEDYAAELRYIQQGLELSMRTDKELRNRLLHGISSDPRFQVAFFQLPETTRELMDGLRSLASLRHRRAPESDPVRPLCRYCYERCEGGMSCEYWREQRERDNDARKQKAGLGFL